MSSTIAKVLPLALGAAISPVLLLLQVATLASKNYPLRRALLILASSSAVTAIVIIAISLTNQQSTTTSAPQESIHGWIEIVLATLLAANALRIILAPPSDTEVKAKPDEANPRLHPVRYLLLGLAAMVTNFTTIVLLIPAVHEVVTAPISNSDQVVLLISVGLLVEFVAFFPIIVVVAAGKKGPVMLDRLSNFLHRHRHRIAIVVSLVFAIYLAYSGIKALA